MGNSLLGCCNNTSTRVDIDGKPEEIAGCKLEAMPGLLPRRGSHNNRHSRRIHRSRDNSRHNSQGQTQTPGYRNCVRGSSRRDGRRRSDPNRPGRRPSIVDSCILISLR